MMRWSPVGGLAAIRGDGGAPLLSALTRGIQDISAEVVGFVRVVYALFLFMALDGRRLQFESGVGIEEGAGRWVSWLLDRPEVVARLELILLGLLVLFGVGLFTRLVYVLFAAGLTVWVAVMLRLGTNIHVWEVPFLTVLCLIPVRWGDAFSLDEAIRRWRGRGHPPGRHGTQFGFAVWMPGVILGAIWTGAAVSKIQASGLEWITGGAVKYHWVIDSPQAAVDWGLWIATQHWAAVIMSFLGVALEATFIAAVFARRTATRIVLAMTIGGSLVAGFYLFHGVLWWTWVLVFLLFVLPWDAGFRSISTLLPLRTIAFDPSDPGALRTARFLHAIDWWNRKTFVDARTTVPFAFARRAGQPAAPLHLRPVQGLMVVAICGLMITELPEGFGRFTSYSNTYASTADFDMRGPIKPVDQLWIRYGTARATRILDGSNDADVMTDAIHRLARGESLSPPYVAAINEIHGRLCRDDRDACDTVTLVRESTGFDWDAGRFDPPRAAPVAAVDLATITLCGPPAPPPGHIATPGTTLRTPEPARPRALHDRAGAC